jgi:hypothetical protein
MILPAIRHRMPRDHLSADSGVSPGSRKASREIGGTATRTSENRADRSLRDTYPEPKVNVADYHARRNTLCDDANCTGQMLTAAFRNPFAEGKLDA